MTVTLRVLSAGSEDRPLELTFDGSRIVVGRGSSCDLRLPDRSVSHRHASIRVDGGTCILVDEGSSNGTRLGTDKIEAHVPRTLRSGDRITLGRTRLEVRVDQTPPTFELAQATRDIALELLAQSLAPEQRDTALEVHVDQGAGGGSVLSLEHDEHVYAVGRAPHCDLILADATVADEHAHIVRRGAFVSVRDLGSRTGTWFDEVKLASDRETIWRVGSILRIGRSALSLQGSLLFALAELEQAPDEPLPLEVAEANDLPIPTAHPDPAMAPSPSRPLRSPSRWSTSDILVILASLGIFGMSVAGLIWIFRSAGTP